VCPEWYSFERFLEDMGPKPPGTSIDRVEVDKGYYKSNCRWATLPIQMANKSGLRMLEFRGGQAHVAEICRQLGVSYELVRLRLRRGWPPAKAFGSDEVSDLPKSS
jgi:hypothetical protein